MTEAQMIILKDKLSDEFVPHLPPLLDLTSPVDHQIQKNISRAFSAYAIQKVVGVDTETASKSVVDDYNDHGLDAFYYLQSLKKLFLFQSKLKINEPFSLEEANAFIIGIRDLLNQRYELFNKNVLDRQIELDNALDDASEIIIVVAHTSPIVSQHAQDVINNFLQEPSLDERLSKTWIDFGPTQVLNTLLEEQAAEPVNDELVFYEQQKIDLPRITYYGQVSINALVNLYITYGNRLLEKNIRYFLGIGSSEVNRAINGTLQGAPESFFYLSNGVTAIAHTIEQKGIKDGGRRFEVKGLSIINGAQTIASSHHFITTNPGADTSTARVLLTLIQVPIEDNFSSSITRARNHQNPVSLSQFAALDSIQERLRRELAFDQIVYRYRPEVRTVSAGLDIMTINEASIALALTHPDPNFPIILKREPGTLLDVNNANYSRLFAPNLSGLKLANAIRLYRKAMEILNANEIVAIGLDKLILRHSKYVTLWLTLKSNIAWLNRQDIMSAEEAGHLLSHPLDSWREIVQSETQTELTRTYRGPLAFFRNLTDARPFIVRLNDAGI